MACRCEKNNLVVFVMNTELFTTGGTGSFANQPVQPQFSVHTDFLKLFAAWLLAKLTTDCIFELKTLVEAFQPSLDHHSLIIIMVLEKLTTDYVNK